MTDNQFEIVNPEAEYSALLEQVGETLEKGRGRLVSAVNAVMVQTYWEIGQLQLLRHCRKN